MVVYSGNVGAYTVDKTVSITCTATDALSGIDSTTCQDVTALAYSFPVGSTTVSATAVDRAGNTGNGSTTFAIVVNAPGLGKLTEQFVTNALVALLMKAELDAAAAAGSHGNLRAKAFFVRRYQNLVSAQIGKTITASHAKILIQLAAAL
jgi:HYR domain-containing protein